METKELARQLGISHQMANRLKKQGMDCTSLEAAIVWRKRNLDPFRTKTGRINGNRGVKPVSTETPTYGSANASIDEEKVFTHTMPDLWFSQVQHLNAALKEHEVHLPAETLLKVQGLLFLLYQVEVDRYLNADQVYSIPPIMAIRPEHENYNSMIKSLEQCLNRPAAA